jgi:hypothetical protein
MAATPTVLLLTALLNIASGTESVTVSTGEELRTALRTAAAGARILVAPGHYRGCFAAAGLRGTAEQPILLAAADPARPPVLHGAGECIHLTGVSHVILRRLVLVGARANGLNVDRRDSRSPPSHHIVLDEVTVRDIGGEGNHDGIKLTHVDDFLVRGCVVERWGSGGSAIDMVGCRRGLITGCELRHTNGQGATGIQAKGCTRDVVIHGCRFRSAGQRAINLGGCTRPADLRPGPLRGEAGGIVVVGNEFVGSKAPVAFVGSDGCVVCFNTIYRPTAWVIRILQERLHPGLATCRNGSFRGNLVVWRWRELRAAVDVRAATRPDTFRFGGNWWYCEDRPAHSRPSLPVPDRTGVVGRDPGLVVDRLGITARVATEHGAHARRAAEEYGARAAELAPWALSVHRGGRRAGEPERRSTRGSGALRGALDTRRRLR